MAGYAPGMTLAEQRLFTCASHGRLDDALATLSEGARAGFLDGDGENALHAAASAPITESRKARALVGALVHAGADPLLRCSRGVTPLERCADSGTAEVLRALAEFGGGLEGALMRAIGASREENVLVLLDLGANAQAVHGGSSPMQAALAAWGGPNPAIIALLERAMLAKPTADAGSKGNAPRL